MNRGPSFWTCKRGNKYEAGWRDSSGQYHSKRGFLNRTQALNFARTHALVAWDIISGIPNNEKDISEAVEAFCTRPGVKENTHNLNRYHLEAFIRGLKLKTTRQLTRVNVNRWWVVLRTDGAGSTKGVNRGRAHNEGGQSLGLRIIRTFCYYCLANKWVSEIPFGKGVLQAIKPPKTESKGKYLTEEDRTKFLLVDPRYEVDKHLYRAKILVLYNGLRISQVWGIQKSHFKAPDQLFVPGIKQQSDKWISLHPRAAQALQEALLCSDPASDRIFTYWPHIEAMRNAVRKHNLRVGLVGVRFHDGKHTFISGLMEAGWSLPDVIAASGNSPSTIMTYAHSNKKRVAAKLKSFEFTDVASSQTLA
jgi:integrase